MTVSMMTDSRPTQILGSVDRALRLLQILRDFAPLRLIDASEELGVSPSTAHRLLSALVYRGYAVQDDDRHYLPGPALGEVPLACGSAVNVRRITLPYLSDFVASSGESAHLMVRAGRKVRVLATVIGANTGSIGDQQGAVLPAHHTAGGKALLAELGPEESLSAIDLDPSSLEFQDLRKELNGVARRGFAVNARAGKSKLFAVAVALRDGTGAAAALSVSVPQDRFMAIFNSGLGQQLLILRTRIEVELGAHMVSSGLSA